MFNVLIKKKNSNIQYEEQFNTGGEAQAWLYRIIGAPNDKGELNPHYDVQIDKILSTEEINAEINHQRRLAYPQPHDVIEALVEHIMEGRSEKINEIQAKRLAVKNIYQKSI